MRTFNIALGNMNGIVRFSNEKSDDRNSIIMDASGIAVPIRKLDELKIENGSIALLKIDVEGYEKFVIQGSRKALQKVQCIYFESIETNFLKFGYKLDDLLNLLTNYGFQILEVKGDRARCIPSKPPLQACNDLVAVREIRSFLKRTNFRFSPEIG